MNKKLFEDIGKRVKKRRIELGYTQEYLAEKNGRQYTDDFGNGIRQESFET